MPGLLTAWRACFAFFFQISSHPRALTSAYTLPHSMDGVSFRLPAPVCSMRFRSFSCFSFSFCVGPLPECLSCIFVFLSRVCVVWIVVSHAFSLLSWTFPPCLFVLDLSSLVSIGLHAGTLVSMLPWPWLHFPSSPFPSHLFHGSPAGLWDGIGPIPSSVGRTVHALSFPRTWPLVHVHLVVHVSYLPCPCNCSPSGAIKQTNVQHTACNEGNQTTPHVPGQETPTYPTCPSETIGVCLHEKGVSVTHQGEELSCVSAQNGCGSKDRQ